MFDPTTDRICDLARRIFGRMMPGHAQCIPREIVMTVPSFSTAAEVVAVSDLVTMLPSSLFAAKAASLGLRALAMPLPAHTTKFAMSWHERTHADTAARAFRALVRRVVGVHPVK